jgi:hypothetical protein
VGVNACNVARLACRVWLPFPWTKPKRTATTIASAMTPQPKRLAKREGSFSAFLTRFRCTLNVCGKYYWQAKHSECPLGKCEKCQILWSKCKEKKTRM